MTGDEITSGAAETEPLLSIRDGITTPTLDSYTELEVAAWRRWHHHIFGWPASSLIIATLGVVIGLSVPAIYSPLPLWAAKISNVLGWSYFFAWSLSFYPQLYSNWRRRSVVGLSFDFVGYNVVGFFSYAIYACALYGSESVRAEYAHRHHGTAPGVRLNDVVFALHSCVCGTAFLLQIAIFDRGSQVVSRTCKRVISAILIGVIGTLVSSLLKKLPLQPLDFLYILGDIKIGITLLKYIPQAILSYERRSTIGFAVLPVGMDFAGGILSVAQQVFDATVLGDAAVITGNLAKILVGVVGMSFNVIMLFQHFVLYTDREDVRKPADEASTLAEAGVADLQTNGSDYKPPS